MKEQFFFTQKDAGSCGVCVLNTILAKHSKPGRIFSVRENGTSPARLMRELRDSGLTAKSKRISARNLKPWSILWYPPRGKKGKRGNHYIVFIRVEQDKFLIYDSVEKQPIRLELSELKKKWYGTKKNGWVIEVKKPNGRV